MDERTGQGVGHDAMRMALTRTLAEEMALKREYESRGARFVVTEVGGRTGHDFQEKFMRAISGAALNAGIVEKLPHEIHALFHAAEEAKRGVLVNAGSESSLALKIAIVRSGHWLAVAIFGESAIHPLTNHERCGLGVMNI